MLAPPLRPRARSLLEAGAAREQHPHTPCHRRSEVLHLCRLWACGGCGAEEQLQLPAAAADVGGRVHSEGSVPVGFACCLFGWWPVHNISCMQVNIPYDLLLGVECFCCSFGRPWLRHGISNQAAVNVFWLGNGLHGEVHECPAKIWGAGTCPHASAAFADWAWTGVSHQPQASYSRVCAPSSAVVSTRVAILGNSAARVHT
jgi:hypothetical protein